MAIPAHKTEYFIIENSNLQKKANTALYNEQYMLKFLFLTAAAVFTRKRMMN